MSTAFVSFGAVLEQHRLPKLCRTEVSTVQINVGKICNQTCQHCHVDAGPTRSESMSAQTAERVLAVLENSSAATTVDITGGAPELNPNFRRLVEGSRKAGRHVIDRSNLTILLEPDFEDLASFLAEHGVEITASLPCYTRENVDRQRGRGVFDKSIRALELLNGIGYGISSRLTLNLVFNPLGPSLPPAQEALEAEYKQRLYEDFGIRFNRLFTITNMPISRFAHLLKRTGSEHSYAKLLEEHFNPNTVAHVMCRSLVSIGWDGKLYDCDFNQMLGIPAAAATCRRTVWDIESFDALGAAPVATAHHCFGCTAGAGSSCGGTLA